jgi:hypothetical protein
MPNQFRQVSLITMKRKHIKLLRKDGKYGHWWFVIGDPDDPSSESYGWWPGTPDSLLGVKTTFGGVVGELNGQTHFPGTPTRDPHHADDADEEFHPFVAALDIRTDEQIAECLRRFALSYNGEWRWTFGFGQNCRTFQKRAMAHCGLRKPIPKKWF